MAKEDRDSKPTRASPVGQARHHLEPSLSAHTFESLKYEWVRVRACGFNYTGQLMGADEEVLYLKTTTRWVVLPLANVSTVDLDDRSSQPLGLPEAVEDLMTPSEDS